MQVSIKRIIAISITLLILLRLFFIVAIIPSESMYPTLKINDVAIYQRTSNVKKGDIIIFKREDKIITKRIVGVEGEEIEVCKDGVYINSEKIKEDYTSIKNNKHLCPPIQLKENELFVMGDNRNDSYDSRFYGPIKKEEVIGVLKYKIPLSKWFRKEKYQCRKC